MTAIARAGAAALTADQSAFGSIGPRLATATMFAGATGRPASIGRLEDAVAILGGDAGTRIEAGSSKNQLRIRMQLVDPALDVPTTAAERP